MTAARAISGHCSQGGCGAGGLATPESPVLRRRPSGKGREGDSGATSCPGLVRPTAGPSPACLQSELPKALLTLLLPAPCLPLLGATPLSPPVAV